jgi:hypothetical protein
MSEPRSGGIVKFYEASQNKAIGDFAAETFNLLLKYDRSAVNGLCQTGYASYLGTESAIGRGQVPELFAMTRITMPESVIDEEEIDFRLDDEDHVEGDENVGIRVLALAMGLRSPSLRQVDLKILVPPERRNNGYATTMLAATLHYYFTHREVASVVAKVPAIDDVAIDLCKKFMDPTGRVPYDWMYYGKLVPSMNYSLSIDSLLFSRYADIQSTLEGSDIDEPEVVPYEILSKLHLKE